MVQFRFFTGLALLLILLAGTTVALAQDDGYPLVEFDTCPFDAPPGSTEGETFECGYLYVPENRADPASYEIELPFVVIYSSNATPQADPIIYLEGGPGGSAIAGMDAWLNTPFSADRDIIVFEQRGTGYAFPSLNCWEFDEEEGDELSLAQACHARLIDEGIDLAAYNSRENAADINDLRRALGLDKVNLYGISYGTRLALTVMRDHPAGVRSVVLDGVYPPHVQGYAEQAANGANAIGQLFADCAAQPTCQAAYPDLQNTFYRLVDEWNADPLVLTYDDGDAEEIYGDDLVNMLFGALYNSAVIPDLPYAIQLLTIGESDLGLDILDGALTGAEALAIINGSEEPWEEDDVEADSYYPWDTDADAEGMFESVECYEEVPFQTLAETQAAGNALPPQLSDALSLGAELQFDRCAIWQQPAASPLENEPVASDIPTLVLSGRYDPITPPAWGQTAAAYLPNSFNFTVPGGHGAIDAGDCPVQMAVAFIDNPNRRPDDRCIQGMALQFFVP